MSLLELKEGETITLLIIYRKHSLTLGSSRNTVLKENLERKGLLNGIRAHVRASVFQALQEPQDQQNHDHATSSRSEIVISQELIREYLEWSGYHNALAVFDAECNRNRDTESLEAKFIAQQLNIGHVHSRNPDR